MKTIPIMFAFCFPWPMSNFDSNLDVGSSKSALLKKFELYETVPPRRLDSSKTVRFKGTNVQRGMASWYGKENSVSSTGKKLKHNTPALAHKTLPIGTVVKVTSLRTNRFVKAVVEDRGPYKKDRIVDLNYPAAKELGIVKDGITKVQIEVIN